MNRIRAALLIVAGALLLVVAAAAVVFYVKVYRPIGSPLMAMAAGKLLEERQLRNHAAYLPPPSGELTAEQAATFVAVEEAVLRRLGDGIATLEKNHAELERASDTHALSLSAALRAYQDIKAVYLNAKAAQIEAMNKDNVSKQEFEWIRRQLYAGAGLRFTQIDVSDVLAGVPDPSVIVRRFETDGRIIESNQRLALSSAAKLEKWTALAFFGL